MNILELQKYAEDNGHDSLEFSFINLRGEKIKGKWIDAYYGFFWIEGMQENEFMTVKQWQILASNKIIFNLI